MSEFLSFSKFLLGLVVIINIAAVLYMLTIKWLCWLHKLINPSEKP